MRKKTRNDAEIPVFGQEVDEKTAESAKSAENALFDLSKGSRTFPGGVAPESLVLLTALTLPELLELRADIDKLLPARSLSDLDLEEEVLLQFARTKALYDTVAEDKKTPANQRAQVANACTSILEQLIKMQARLYSAERVKAIESALTKALRELGDEKTIERFFNIYERALENSVHAVREKRVGHDQLKSMPRPA